MFIEQDKLIKTMSDKRQGWEHHLHNGHTRTKQTASVIALDITNNPNHPKGRTTMEDINVQSGSC